MSQSEKELDGYVDILSDICISGWAIDGDRQARIVVRLDHRVIGRGVADLPRIDLHRAAGWRVTLDCPITPLDLLADRAWVEAIGRDGAVLRLPLADVATLVEQTLARYLPILSPKAIADMIARSRRTGASADPAAAGPVSVDLPLSSFQLPVGTVSPDHVALVGHDGHLFLYSGTNNLTNQYVRTSEATAAAMRWFEVIERRQATINARGMRFLQLLIPEKTSVFPDLLPFHLDTPTATYHELTEKLAASAAAACAPNLHAIFSKFTDRARLYRHVDTHLSCFGNYTLFSLALTQIGLSAMPVDFTEALLAHGDLGEHFFSRGMIDADIAPSPDSLPRTERLEVVEDVSTGRNLGRRLVFRNPDAPFSKRVVAFGNSFFSTGSLPQHLSWWFARWFAEFHFVWSSEVDLDYVDHHCPDVVVAQTIERFLPVPVDQ